MYQLVNTTKGHPFAAYDSSGNEVITLTDPVCKYRINGGTKTTFTPTISSYDTDMRDFVITIPDTLVTTVGDSIAISIIATEGNADILIEVIGNLAGLATSAELTAIKGSGWSTETLKSIKDGQTPLATASALTTAQTYITGIKTITDQLTLANIKSQSTSALSDYDGPTKAEMDSALSVLATAASIAALNNVSTAQVLTQIQNALNTYDAPTKAELDAAVLPLATAASVEAISGISPTEVREQIDASIAAYDAPTYAEMVVQFTAIKGSGWSTETLRDIRLNQVSSDTISGEVYTALMNAGLESVGSNVSAIKAITDSLTLANIKSQSASALSDYDAPTKAELDTAVSLLATKDDVESISITVEGSDLITVDTVFELPFNKTITFGELIKSIYQYRKW